MASKTVALGLTGLFISFLVILIVVQVLKPYRREGFVVPTKAVRKPVKENLKY